jgi:hypothetical protein
MLWVVDPEDFNVVLLTKRQSEEEGFADGFAEFECGVRPRRVAAVAGHVWHDKAEHTAWVPWARINSEFDDRSSAGARSGRGSRLRGLRRRMAEPQSGAVAAQAAVSAAMGTSNLTIPCCRSAPSTPAVLHGLRRGDETGIVTDLSVSVSPRTL